MPSEVSSFSSLLRKHIKVFQLFGIFGLSLSSCPRRQCRNERLLRAWSLLLFVLFNITALFIFTSKDEFFFLGDSFGHFNDVLKLSFAHIAVMTIYLESLLQWRTLQRFWVLYAQLLKSRSLLEQGALSWRQHGSFLAVFYGTEAVSVVCLVFFIFFQRFTRHLVLFWTMFMPFMYVVHYRNMQIILHIDIMRLELETLRRDLRLLVDYTRFARRVAAFDGFEEFLRRKLLHEQKVYGNIYAMFESFQGTFGFSTVALLLSVSVRVLVDSYFMFYTIYQDLDRLAENLLILPALFEIPVLLLAARNCMNVVKHITFELHNIVSQIGAESALSVQIQNFSLQMLHQKIRIDGVGITTMDGYMLMRAVASVITYMIFFVQFMPKFGIRV